jgi:hypothetical protein
MTNSGRRRGHALVANVAVGLATAGIIALGGMALTVVRTRDELHVETVLHDRQGAFGASPVTATTTVTVEVLAPFCGTPNVVVSGGVRYETRLVTCVFALRVWNQTHHAVTVTVKSAQLRFGHDAYSDITMLRVVPALVPPRCNALVALIFELRRDERGSSVLLWTFAVGTNSDVRVGQPLGPIRTSGTPHRRPLDSPPSASCPD